MNNDDHERRVAVLIDAENIAPKYLPIVLSEANNLGSVNIKRIYGDWTMPQMSSWRTVILDNSIQPIQQYSNVSRKNSSDSALIIDAMDLLYQGRFDCFCIVSSDSDFTRLAARLRESEARNALLHIRAVLTRSAHTRKVSLDIREKHGDTRITEGLCHHL